MARTPAGGSNGAAENMFLEPGEAESPAALREARSSRAGGLVVALEDHLAPPADSSNEDLARFTRTDHGLAGVASRGRRRASVAEANARTLLARITRHRYGAVIAVSVVAALLLAVSWLGISLRSEAFDRQQAHASQSAVTHSLAGTRALNATLAGQRDRARRATAVARREQEGAETTARRWRARALRGERRLARARARTRNRR